MNPFDMRIYANRRRQARRPYEVRYRPAVTVATHRREQPRQTGPDPRGRAFLQLSWHESTKASKAALTSLPAGSRCILPTHSPQTPCQRFADRSSPRSGPGARETSYTRPDLRVSQRVRWWQVLGSNQRRHPMGLSCQAAVCWRCDQAAASSQGVPVLRHPCRMPVSRLASWRRAAWRVAPRPRSWS